MKKTKNENHEIDKKNEELKNKNKKKKRRNFFFKVAE